MTNQARLGTIPETHFESLFNRSKHEIGIELMNHINVNAFLCGGHSRLAKNMPKIRSQSLHCGFRLVFHYSQLAIRKFDEATTRTSPQCSSSRETTEANTSVSEEKSPNKRIRTQVIKYSWNSCKSHLNLSISSQTIGGSTFAPTPRQRLPILNSCCATV